MSPPRNPSTAAGLASEDADDRAEVLMRRSLGTRPGVIAYVSLALFAAIAILGSIIATQRANTATQRARAAVEANCQTSDATNRVVVGIIGELTAPRILAPTATPEQVAANEQANVKAAENREAKIAMLRTLRCDKLGDTTDPEPIPVAAEPPPAVVIGPDGEVGPTGLTGLVGPPGKTGVPGVAGQPGPVGPPGGVGVAGEAGKAGRDGADGRTVVGPPGPAGPPGAPAPTTTAPPPTTAPPCLLGPLCPP